jgi:copper homeostasis protein (lipoprotein)
MFSSSALKPLVTGGLAALAGCVTISSSSIGTFAGVMPCADCAGILTELRLSAEQPSGRPTRYELTETYLGSREGDRSISRTGRWGTSRGSTVVQLDLGRPEMPRSFQRVGDEELRLLDRNQREMLSKAPRSLYRVSELPAVTLVEGDSGRAIDVERGQRVFVVLGADRATGYDWALEPSAPGPLASLGDSVYAQGAGALGSGGSAIWFFRASGSGRQELAFQYRRLSQRDAPAAKTVSFLISVR